MKTKADLDHEGKETYSVTVQVSDGRDDSGTAENSAGGGYEACGDYHGYGRGRGRTGVIIALSADSAFCGNGGDGDFDGR